MVIGKTSSSISKAEIFNKYSEAEVIASVFPEIKSLPCLICSPLRVDKKPSLSIYVSNGGHVYLKDHATKEHYGLLDFLCAYWSCGFKECLDRICSLFIAKDAIDIKPKAIRTLTRKEADTLTQIQVAVRPWRDYDYKYWADYGVEKQWLKYAGILPISHKIVTKKENPHDKGKTYIFPADKLAYVFVEKKEGRLSIKIYQPYSKDFKWCSKMDASIVGLWTKIPEYGDRVVLCSSMKDALCLSCNLHIPTLCLQGEGYGMSDTAVNELKRRYKKVFICFDTDAPGLEDGKKLAEKTGFINVVPDLGAEKDLSDYYKSLKDKEQFKQLEKLFN